AGRARALASRARAAPLLSGLLELVTGILLAAGGIFFVLEPILRPDTAGRGTGEKGRGPADEGEDPDDDLSPRAVALRALKEIEFDRATGKLSDADYDTLKARYTAEALAALRAEPRTGDEGRGTGLARWSLVPRPPSLVPHVQPTVPGPRPM